MRKDRKESLRIKALDYAYMCFDADVERFGKLAEKAEADPSDQVLQEVVKALRTRINMLLQGIKSLDEHELYLFHLRYEMKLSYEKMEGYLFYSKKSIQLKNWRTLARILQSEKYIA